MSNLRAILLDMDHSIRDDPEFYDYRTITLWKKHRDKLVDFVEPSMTAESLRAWNPYLSSTSFSNLHLSVFYFQFNSNVEFLIKEITEKRATFINVFAYSSLKMCELMLTFHLFSAIRNNYHIVSMVPKSDQVHIKNFYDFRIDFKVKQNYSSFDSRLMNHSYMMLRNLMVNFPNV